MYEKNYISNCCSALVYQDREICSDCKEHCGLEEVKEEDEAKEEILKRESRYAYQDYLMASIINR